MRSWNTIHLTTVALFIISASPVAVFGQGLPQAAIAETIRHLKADGEMSAAVLVLETDGFPRAEDARNAASAHRILAGRHSEIIQCTDDRRDCRVVDGNAVLRLHDFQLSDDGHVLSLLITVSTEVVTPDTGGRLFPHMREITLTHDRGWKVTADEVVVRS